MASAEPAQIRVEVAFSPAVGQVMCSRVVLAAGLTVLDAIKQSGLPIDAQNRLANAPRIGVWGQLRPLDHVLRDGDRVEVYRALLIDPKDARRLRHRGQRQAKR
jgi:putative ubiquitin-RnfH superfamily antitoxin RatB of RatAB toxin-antitoxin module